MELLEAHEDAQLASLLTVEQADTPLKGELLYFDLRFAKDRESLDPEVCHTIYLDRTQTEALRNFLNELLG